METDPELSRNIQNCPVEVAMGYLGRKWSLMIIRDLFFGKRRFSEFLEANPGLSTKMLSTRLRDLAEVGVVEKRITSKDPVLIEYVLTPRGMALNRVLFELAVFSMEQHPEQVFKVPPETITPYLPWVRRMFIAP